MRLINELASVHCSMLSQLNLEKLSSGCHIRILWSGWMLSGRVLFFTSEYQDLGYREAVASPWNATIVT